jgi:hypothetical protein
MVEQLDRWTVGWLTGWLYVLMEDGMAELLAGWMVGRWMDG